MEPGKVSQTVYRRSILKQLHKDGHAVLFPPGQEESCYGICLPDGREVISSSVSLYGNEKDLCMFAIAQAANHLASRGADPAGVSIRIMLPDFAYESRLKAMMSASREAADSQGIEILEAGAQNVPGIQTGIVHVTAVGCVEPEKLVRSCMAQPGQDIVLLKWIGLEGTLRIKREKEEELARRFVPAFLNQIEAYRPELFSIRAMKTAAAIGVSAMHQIVDGGILAALWDMAEGAGIGLSVDMRKISVRQETIELCEYFHLNPYQLTSAGGVLVVTPKGQGLADTLEREGVPAVIIGHTTDSRERVLYNGSEMRYLDRPAPDELTKLFVK